MVSNVAMKHQQFSLTLVSCLYTKSLIWLQDYKVIFWTAGINNYVISLIIENKINK